MKLWTVKTLIELQLDFVCLGIPIFEVSTFSEVMLCCSGLCTFCKTNMELATHIILPKFGIDLLINSPKIFIVGFIKEASCSRVIGVHGSSRRAVAIVLEPTPSSAVFVKVPHKCYTL